MPSEVGLTGILQSFEATAVVMIINVQISIGMLHYF